MTLELLVPKLWSNNNVIKEKEMMNPSPERCITPGNADIKIKLSGVNLLFKIF